MAESSDFSPMKRSEATISDRLFGTVKPTSNGHVTVVERGCFTLEERPPG